MANKTINQLTAVSSIAAADEIEVQKSGESTTKKGTVSQLLSAESTLRAAQDDIIEAAVGLDASGIYPELANSWYLRAADFVAGITDRSGLIANITQSIANALRLLDAKIYNLSNTIIAQFWKRTGTIVSPATDGDELNIDVAKIGIFADGDYVDIDKYGKILLVGKAVYKKVIDHPVVILDAARSTMWLNNLKILTFSPSTIEEYQFLVNMPQSYQAGTDIIPLLRWVALGSAATPLYVRWGLEYCWSENGVINSVTKTMYVSTHSPNEALLGNKEYMDIFESIAGAGHTKGSVLCCRLFRDATHAQDTFSQHAGVLSIGFVNRNDSLGIYS
jgi:hypothetical protein